MHPIVDRYNAIAGAAIALLTAIFGAYWYIFAAYFMCMVMDYLTGWFKARTLHRESSAVGLLGVIKKVFYWVIIGVAFLMAEVFARMGEDVWQIDLSFLNMIGWFTLGSLLVNEIRSILENLVECGLEVPQFLIKGLAVADHLMTMKDLPEFLEDGKEQPADTDTASKK